MKRKLLLAAAAMFLIAAPVANAQQIVAQSNYVNRGQQAAVPQVSITVRADFVLFSVRYETATRAVEAREDELAKTFATIVQRAARAEGMSIEVGTPGLSAAIETAAIKELIQNRGNDRSGIDIVLKVNVKEKETFDQIRARVEKFVKETPSRAASRRSLATASFSASPIPRNTAIRSSKRSRRMYG